MNLGGLAGRMRLRPGAALPTIASSRPMQAARLARGLPAGDLPGTLGALFTLCAHAHRGTATCAVAAATGRGRAVSSAEARTALACRHGARADPAHRARLAPPAARRARPPKPVLLLRSLPAVARQHRHRPSRWRRCPAGWPTTGWRCRSPTGCRSTRPPPAAGRCTGARAPRPRQPGCCGHKPMACCRWTLLRDRCACSINPWPRCPCSPIACAPRRTSAPVPTGRASPPRPAPGHASSTPRRCRSTMHGCA